MKIFDSWTPAQFESHVHLMEPTEKDDVVRQLRLILDISDSVSSDALSVLVISKTHYIADVRGAFDPSIFEIVASHSLNLSRRAFMYEAQFSGLDGMFSGDMRDWLTNIMHRIAFGAEDFVCIDEELRSVIVLSHSYDLRVGDLADRTYFDPQMLALSKRLENEGQMRASIERRVAERRRQRTE